MAPKKVADAAKAKAGKQKKIAIGLGLVLTLAMAYAVHTMMALSGKPSSAPQAAPVTLSTSTTPAPAAAPTAGLPAVNGYSKATADALKDYAFDRVGLGARGLAYEKLDQLTVEVILGVR